MTNIDLDKLEQSLAGATPGRWELDPERYTANNCCWMEDHWDVDGENGGWIVHADERPTAEWIAAIHNAAPALIAELREARATIETLRADVERRKIRNTLSRMGMPDEPETIEAWRENTIGWMERAEAAEATIERVREMCHETGAYRALTLGRYSSARVLAVDILAALDGER